MEFEYINLYGNIFSDRDRAVYVCREKANINKKDYVVTKMLYNKDRDCEYRISELREFDIFCVFNSGTFIEAICKRDGIEYFNRNKYDKRDY